jgi:hypothetical protein
MTYAPPSLLDLRAFLTPITRLSAANLGIVGDTAHATKGTSYHLGKDQLTDGAYSRVLPRDKAGLTNAASALDIGNHPGLRALSLALVGLCRANAPGTSDIREVIYSPDGRTVLRWDRERGFSSAPRAGEADDSHLWHTHISWYRDSEQHDKVGVFRAITGDTAGQEDDVALIDFTLPTTEVAGEIKVTAAAGASVVTIDGGDRPTLKTGMVRPAFGGTGEDVLKLGIRGDVAHYMVYVGNEIGFVRASDVEFTPYADADAEALLVATRAGYDLARSGFAMKHPAPTVTWPPRP